MEFIIKLDKRGPMIIAGTYSFKGGEEMVLSKFPNLYDEIKSVIHAVDAEKLKTKVSDEKTSKGKLLYSPPLLNKEFKKYFKELGWGSHKQPCQYPTEFYSTEYKDRNAKNTKSFKSKNAFREMDFVKDKLGVEVQFGKYSFMVYNVCAKMTIFNKFGIIDTGVEIVPVKQLVSEMSTGVSYFEQFIWDLKHRGIADIDIPVLIIGIDSF
jgi:hypothetical protein